MEADVQSVIQMRTEDFHRHKAGPDTYDDVCQMPAEYDDYHSIHTDTQTYTQTQTYRDIHTDIHTDTDIHTQTETHTDTDTELDTTHTTMSVKCLLNTTTTTLYTQTHRHTHRYRHTETSVSYTHLTLPTIYSV